MNAVIAYQDADVTLYHGDCLEVMPTLADESVDMIWTDPPYGHGNMDGDLQEAITGIPGSRQKPVEPIVNDNPDDMRRVIDGMLTETARVLKHDCCCCCCCCCCGGGPRPTFAWVANRMDSNGMSFFHAVIWDKSARGIGLGWRYRRDYEMVMVAHRKGGKLAWADNKKAVSNIVRMAPVLNRTHPNEKPLALVQYFLSLHTLPNDTVLDPFAGSGTTLIAALELGRRAIGIELDERWVSVAVDRIRTWRRQGRLKLA